jgi:hypothetical protein
MYQRVSFLALEEEVYWLVLMLRRVRDEWKRSVPVVRSVVR